jgi:hypothetical protein
MEQQRIPSVSTPENLANGFINPSLSLIPPVGAGNLAGMSDLAPGVCVLYHKPPTFTLLTLFDTLLTQPLILLWKPSFGSTKLRFRLPEKLKGGKTGFSTEERVTAYSETARWAGLPSE